MKQRNSQICKAIQAYLYIVQSSITYDVTPCVEYGIGCVEVTLHPNLGILYILGRWGVFGRHPQVGVVSCVDEPMRYTYYQLSEVTNRIAAALNES